MMAATMSVNAKIMASTPALPAVPDTLQCCQLNATCTNYQANNVASSYIVVVTPTTQMFLACPLSQVGPLSPRESQLVLMEFP